MGSIKEENVGVARLKYTRDNNLKGTRIGPPLFYTSKLYNKYIKKSKFDNHKAHQKENHSMSGFLFIQELVSSPPFHHHRCKIEVGSSNL